jgi:hypothetical protein
MSMSHHFCGAAGPDGCISRASAVIFRCFPFLGKLFDGQFDQCDDSVGIRFPFRLERFEEVLRNNGTGIFKIRDCMASGL